MKECLYGLGKLIDVREGIFVDVCQSGHLVGW